MMTTENKIDPLLLALPLPIHTPRLIIRPVMPGDEVEMLAALNETWDDVHRWMPWATEPLTLEHYRSLTHRVYAKTILREDFMMVGIDRATEKMAVFTGVHRFDWKIRRVEIGYWARKEFQGRGLVTESTNALARYAFLEMKARTVAIEHADGNDASRAVIERIAFKPEGRMRNATMTPDGVIRDQVWYSHTDINDLPPLDVRWGAP